MDLAFQLCSYLLWFPLEVLAISCVLRVGIRRYPLIFAYLVVSFLAACASMPAVWAYYQGKRANGSGYVHLYWLNEGITDALIFAVVITLIYRASSGLATRRTVRRGLALGSVLYIGISFLIHYESTAAIGIWMAPWTRDITFCAAILDLALWAILIGSRTKDTRLLMLSGGMGIMFCGLAIGESLRTIAIHYRSHPIVSAGNAVEQIANIFFLYVWWQTFRREAAERLLPPLTSKAAAIPE
jgi:hypothetical protein